MLPYDMRRVLDRFLRRIIAYDRADALADHDTVSTIGVDYPISAVILPTSETDLQLLEEGEIKNDSETVFTRNKQLFFKDVQSPTATAKQTFIRYNGKIYRIKTEVDRSEDGMYRKYIAVRHVERKIAEGA